MYLVKCKVQRQASSKPKPETYLVISDTLIDVEAKLGLELGINDWGNTGSSISSCVSIKFQDIFENGEGSFFIMKVIVEDVEGKAFKESFLQEAVDHSGAIAHFRNNVTYGELNDTISTNYVGIVR